jgi:sec-independent protein translocase protein TatA
MMFGAHVPELLAILAIGLIFFGPKRLPEIGASLGKSIRDFKHGVSDLGDQVHGNALPEGDSSVIPTVTVHETQVR